MRNLQSLPEVTFDDVPVKLTSLDSAVSGLIADCQDSAPGYAICFLNAWSFWSARVPVYRSTLHHTVNFPDGAPLASAIARKAATGAVQVRGPAFFEAVVDRGRENRLAHFIVGGTSDGLDLLERTLLTRYPGARIVGKHAPPFGEWPDEDRAELIEKLSRSEADVVWLSLGAPKQDIAASALSQDTNLIVAAVGAAFDFSSGLKPVAPTIIRWAHLEWMFRLLAEPRRLWRRYLAGNTWFTLLMIRERMRRR